ncbi:DUF4386 domain-containing protein [Georgenia daeguensis]|uniref:DUF4386 domain-containing protein n=1 Tax=Georgenia daeguensis TaxID=908355 RepID=A0ABP8EWG2_9MICO
MSTRTTGRIVGALILLAFVLYGGGTILVGSGAGVPAVLSDVGESRTQISAGALLILLNSAAVAGIGVLALPVLKQHHEVSAYAYLITRTFEALMLAVGALCLLVLIPLSREYAEAGAVDASALPALARVAQEGNQTAYQFAMIGLGLGSILFCRVLLRARLVPRLLAVWGMAGYAIVALGMSLDVLGYGVGLMMWIPGGLFEVVLGVLLLARGFPALQSGDRDGAVHRAPVPPVVTIERLERSGSGTS